MKTIDRIRARYARKAEKEVKVSTCRGGSGRQKQRPLTSDQRYYRVLLRPYIIRELRTYAQANCRSLHRWYNRVKYSNVPCSAFRFELKTMVEDGIIERCGAISYTLVRRKHAF